MTARVRIEHLEPGNDQSLVVEVTNPADGRVFAVIPLKPGQSVEQYVHPHQALHVREVME